MTPANGGYGGFVRRKAGGRLAIFRLWIFRRLEILKVEGNRINSKKLGNFQEVCFAIARIWNWVTEELCLKVVVFLLFGFLSLVVSRSL